MQKKIQILVLLLFTTIFSFAQDANSNIDYQYIRTKTDYHAYGVYLNKKNVVDLHLASTFDLKRLKTIAIKTNNSTIIVPFVKLNERLVVDQENIHTLAVTIDCNANWFRRSEKFEFCT